ncbi:phosphodiester glycosidase family protein [Luteolibacter luteus]|uniref:Phosphodiester glycosidase domain-containing protein n=1 Tax=Luteolibacter luteus TaxID=2728835 RepID=A0A858RCU9_9BACT|nr:phosphodiester glycosidase family protein [Luteolibacter luteus]QJE94471.1 hypothetical protein HHL09_01260 [Luteolibacter luteus]
MKALICVIFAACGSLGAAVKEQPVEHAGVKFRVVKVAPEVVRLVWKDAGEAPFRSFERVQTAFSAQGKVVKFVMNAGIFEPGGIPSGLHVENGKELRPLNQAAGKGNFFLKPNGVFSIDRAGKARVWECAAYAAVATHPQLALQSGPLLLHGGKRHPAFKEGSENKLVRNGVGVDAQGQVVFAITAKGERVNLWDFAGLFLQLGCKDALFLDGDISQMSVNPSGPPPGNQFGAMLVIVE